MKLGLLASIAFLCMSAMAFATSTTGGHGSSTYRKEVRANLHQSLQESVVTLVKLKIKLSRTSPDSDQWPTLIEAVQIEKARIWLIKSYLWKFDSLCDAELWDIVVEQEYAVTSPNQGTSQECAGHV